MKRLSEKTFPDTADGAREYLLEVSSLPKKKIRNATAEMDPVVSGVWKLTLSPTLEVLIYDLGDPEKEPDFEEFEKFGDEDDDEPRNELLACLGL